MSEQQTQILKISNYRLAINLEIEGKTLQEKGDIEGARDKYKQALFINDNTGWAGECIRLSQRLENFEMEAGYIQILRKHWDAQNKISRPDRTGLRITSPLGIAKTFYENPEVAA